MRWRRLRPLLLASLLLLAGAVVNVAVSETLLLLSGHPRRERQHDLPATWPLPVPDEWAGPEISQSESLGFRFTGWMGWTGRPPDRARRSTYSGTHVLGRYQGGWPLLSVEYWQTISLEGGARLARPRDGALGGIGIGREKGPGGTAPRRLGLVPVFPGFAINTVFYAAVLALPLSFFPIRRRLRARRGRCPKCGYDLAGLAAADPAATCPECGAAR